MSSRALLAPTRIVEIVNAVAERAYRSGLLRRHDAPVPVVSVGNIAMGGTGKTPLVAALARTFLEAGARPAVLTRGYRRKDAAAAMAWRDPSPDWRAIGDEPALLARSLPEVPVIVDSDRVRGARTAVQRAGATHLLLDDGFQHWRLRRDLDIVVVPAADPLCRRALRREHPRALGRAHAIVVSGTDDLSAGTAAALRRFAPTARLAAVAARARQLHRGGAAAALERLRGARLLAFAGIARPERFFDTLRDLGAAAVEAVPFPDHHAYERTEIETLLARAEAAGLEPVTTAKDAVKIPADLAPRCWWLEIESVPTAGSFEALLAPVLRPARLEFSG